MASTTDPSIENLVLALVRFLPVLAVRTVAAELATLSALPTEALQDRIAASASSPSQRSALLRFLQDWATYQPHVPPLGVAYALRGAIAVLEAEQAAERVEVVWTGPNPGGAPLRRTESVLIDVVDGAETTLTIVSFAAYDIADIAAALKRAAERGVHLCILIESAKASAGKIAYESIAAFGATVLAEAAVYEWPLERRPVDDKGRHGSLHAKCAVADDRVLFVSSANLTRYALDLNMELGLVVRGGAAPSTVSRHITRLIEHGVLVAKTTTLG